MVSSTCFPQEETNAYERSRSKNKEDGILCRTNCPRLMEEVKHHCSPSRMMNSNVRRYVCQLLITFPWLSQARRSRIRSITFPRGPLYRGSSCPRRPMTRKPLPHIRRTLCVSMCEAILLRARLYNLPVSAVRARRLISNAYTYV